MSYVDPSQNPDQNDENQSQVDAAQNPSQQQNQSSGQNQPSSAPPSTSGGGGSGIVSGGGVGGAAGSSAPTSSAAPGPSKSGSWTNLNSYLDANADQGAAVGSQIANTINSQGQSDQDAINNLSSGFNQAVQASTVNANQGAVDQSINDAESNNLSAADQTAFDQQANASYSGPTDITQATGYSQAAQGASNAAVAAQQAQTEAGRDVLLQNQFNNASTSGYNQGENNLDQLLLEGSGGAGSINQAANQWTGLGGQLNSDVTTDNANAASGAATTQATAANALSDFNTQRTAADTSVASALAAQQAGYSTDYNALVSALNGYSGGNLNLNQQQATTLGLGQNQRLYDLYQQSPQLGTQYLSQAAFNAGAEITPQQQAELAALDTLGAGANQTATNQYTNAALAGTQNADNSIDTSGFQQAVANSNQAFQDAAAQNVKGTGNASNDFGYNITAPTLGQWGIPGSANQFIRSGSATAQAQANETLASYLAANQGNANAGSTYMVGGNNGTNAIALLTGGGSIPFGTAGTNYSSQNALSQQQAEAAAQQNLWQNLQNEIGTSGYNNQVDINGAPIAAPSAEPRVVMR